MSKKAITPLISTVLLVSFAVLLGIFVMNWGKTTYAVEQETNLCESSALGIVTINEVAEMCYQSNNIKFTIENQGQTEVSGFKVSIIGDTGIQQFDLERGLASGAINEITTPYDSSVGTIRKIKIVPRISNNGIASLCPKSGVEIDRVALCETI